MHGAIQAERHLHTRRAAPLRLAARRAVQDVGQLRRRLAHCCVARQVVLDGNAGGACGQFVGGRGLRVRRGDAVRALEAEERADGPCGGAEQGGA